MPRHFRRHGDGVRATLQPFEVALLRSTRDQLRGLLLGGDADEPVLRRLFPTAVLGDADADAEVRTWLHADLFAARLAGLDALVEVLDRAEPVRGGVRVYLVEDEPLLVLGVLNDLRLAIGATIDVDALDRDAVREDDPVAYPLAVMDHLGWLQEQLLAVLDPSSVQHAQQRHEEDRG
jgi:hypothetical protein